MKNQAAELKLRAERKLGELLKTRPHHPPGPEPKDTFEEWRNNGLDKETLLIYLGAILQEFDNRLTQLRRNYQKDNR